ncbi:Cell division protein [Brugia malayi]|uniref:Cell division protein n=2 Tax=Brugia malayi TaxID=6279 RepID=A0A4E9F1H9_BRUMA|nr:Cell division protein [Brugia malayi]VIO89734.1 Cell division protein [Brugia malayi]
MNLLCTKLPKHKLVLNKKSKTANWTTATRESEISDHDRRILKKINRLDGETSCSNNLERTSVRSIIAGYQQRQLSSKPSYTAQGLSPGNLVVLRGKEDISSQISLESEVVESKVHTDILPVESNEFQKVLPKTNDMMESRKPMAAPPAPPLPPIPTHLKNSQLKLLNGDSGSSPISSSFSNGIHKRTLTTITSASGSTQDSSKHETTDAKFVPKGMISQKFNVSGSTTEEFRTLKLNGHVGFDSLPHQLVRKCTERGFQFNLMCVGETGMGKTTLIESLFNMKLEFHPCNNELKTVELLSRTYDVVEGGIRLKLTIVETAGFGDQLDKDKSAQVIVDFINEQFEKYLKEELKIKRCLDYYDDTRIHACLYFISPTGHGLKALDVVTLQRLAERVNVIPVIAKADTTCKDELIRFKSKILSELRSHNIPIYQFPTDDETVRAINTELNQLVPYAVVGSTDFVKKENGKMVRARRYPWGMVEVENEEHCDFVKLREAVLRTNVDALRERTHRVLYEAYRRERLRAMKFGDGDTGPKMMEAFAQKQREFIDEMANRDTVFRDEFATRVKKKEEEMKRREELLNLRAKKISENFEEELRRIESQMHTLLEEKAKYELKTAGKKAKK